MYLPARTTRVLHADLFPAAHRTHSLSYSFMTYSIDPLSVLYVNFFVRCAKTIGLSSPSKGIEWVLDANQAQVVSVAFEHMARPTLDRVLDFGGRCQGDYQMTI